MSKNLLVIGFLILALVGGAFVYKKITKKQFAKVPVYYLPHSTVPMVDIEIESKKYSVEWDSGSNGYLTLHEDVLNQLKDKQEDGSASSHDIHNNTYEKQHFIIPELKIENFEATPFYISSESDQFVINARLGTEEDRLALKDKLQYIQGRIGMGLGMHFCLYFDLPNSFIYIARDETALFREKGFSLDGFVEAPLFPSEKQAVVILETDLGPKKFLLDSGCEISLLNDPDKSHEGEASTYHLHIGNANLGTHKFFAFSFPEYFQFDGILGIPFFKDRALLIDLQNNRARIGPSVKPKLF